MAQWGGAASLLEWLGVIHLASLERELGSPSIQCKRVLTSHCFFAVSRFECGCQVVCCCYIPGSYGGHAATNQMGCISVVYHALVVGSHKPLYTVH